MAIYIYRLSLQKLPPAAAIVSCKLLTLVGVHRSPEVVGFLPLGLLTVSKLMYKS